MSQQTTGSRRSVSSAAARWGAASRRSRHWRTERASLRHESEALAAAREYLSETFARLAREGQARGGRRARRARAIRDAGDASELADCDAVVEAIVENLDDQARAVPRTRSSGRRALHSRVEHLVAVHHRDRRRLRASGARRGLPLLQSRAADEGRGSDRRPAQRPAVGDALMDLAQPHGPHAGAREGHAGLHRQSRRARLRHRGAAHRRRRRRRLRDDRPHHARAGGLPARAVRAAGPDRARRLASGDGIDLPPVL